MDIPSVGAAEAAAEGNLCGFIPLTGSIFMLMELFITEL